MSGRKQRYIYPGAVKFVERRVIGRRFLIIPSAGFRQEFFYWLGHYARLHGILLHDVVLMSNHYHLLCTDVRGVLPDFLHDFNARIALVVRRRFGWKGALWEPQERCSILEVVTESAFVKCSNYVHTNPISAGISMRSEEWPGLVTDFVEEFSLPESEQKKHKALAKNQTLPSGPCALNGYANGELEQLASEVLEQAKIDAHLKFRSSGKRYLGVQNALKTCRTFRPADASETKNVRSPEWVAVTREGIAYVKALLARFYGEYRAAWVRQKEGKQKEEFPYGTWKMVRVHGCPCAPP